MRLAVLAAAAVSGSVNSAVPMKPPAWLSVPATSDMARVAPDRAISEGIDGGAVLACAVSPKNRMEHCEVTFEAPEGMGFGAAALRLAPLFRIRPGDPPGQLINIPILWHFADSRAKGLLIAHPLWETVASFADIASAYPKSANGETGLVTLRCRVNGEGRIGLCTTSREEPSNQSFAGAAYGLTDKFRVRMPVEFATNGKPLFADLQVRFEDPAGADFRERHIGEPNWLVGLDPDRIAKLYPPDAAAKGVKTGLGVAECIVQADGTLANCKPLAGDPDGLGFSEAAVKAASAMRMSPWTRDGGPVDGANVRIPIRFNLAAPPTTAPAK